MPQTGPKGTTANDQPRSPEDLNADLELLRADIAKLTEQIQEMRQHSYTAARHAANEGMDQLRAQGEAAYESLRASASDMERQLTEAVYEKPMRSLAIAAGIGYLFALISRR